MDKKFIQSKLRARLSEMDESAVEEANYIVKADDIDKVGDKLEAKLDDDDVVKVVDEADLVDCPCNGKCKKGAKCKEPVEESSTEEEENNPWAICTASVGREDKEKYEACVKKVKKQYNIKESKLKVNKLHEPIKEGKKDINCKCGWGWNKDETNASDMYKCHKCGADNSINESEYQGKKVKLNKPMRGDVKKYKVYVKNDKGNVVKVNFGDKNMEIKRDDPERRKAFRARHGCENPGPKWKAKYWSCKFWSTKSVSDLLGEEENPCWSGYEMVGMKKKDGKEVPNCVKIKESVRPKMTKDQLIESVIRNSKTIFTVKEFIKENTNAPITLDGQKIDVSSIEIDGVDRKDYPDFVDAYFSYAEYESGQALTDNELDKLTDEQGELLNSLIHSNQLF